MLHDPPVLLRRDYVWLIFPADPENELEEERISCQITFGDSTREGQALRASSYEVEVIDDNEPRGLHKGDILKGITRERLELV